MGRELEHATWYWQFVIRKAALRRAGRSLQRRQRPRRSRPRVTWTLPKPAEEAPNNTALLAVHGRQAVLVVFVILVVVYGRAHLLALMRAARQTLVRLAKGVRTAFVPCLPPPLRRG